MSGFHRDIKGDQNHIIHFREYATKEAREAATGLDATHLHKIALQADDNTMWQLVDVSPVEWQALGGTGGGRVSGEIVSFWGTIDSAGRPLNMVTGEPMLEWGCCDGRTYLSPDGRSVGTPNMRDRFIVGAGGSYGKGATGGASTVTVTAAQMPYHVHSRGVSIQTNKHFTNLDDSASIFAASTSTGGAGSSHAHENKPPYIGVYFIMYL